MRTIQIDLDIHKLIEGARLTFEETPNATLRRLLGLPDTVNTKTEPLPDGGAGGWRGKGVVLPNGTQLRMAYSGRSYRASIEAGFWVSDGKKFTSPSGAASELAVTRKGKKTRLDGWGYWEALRPGEDSFVPLSILYREANPQEELSLEQLGLS